MWPDAVCISNVNTDITPNWTGKWSGEKFAVCLYKIDSQDYHLFHEKSGAVTSLGVGPIAFVTTRLACCSD